MAIKNCLKMTIILPKRCRCTYTNKLINEKASGEIGGWTDGRTQTINR